MEHEALLSHRKLSSDGISSDNSGDQNSCKRNLLYLQESPGHNILVRYRSYILYMILKKHDQISFGINVTVNNATDLEIANFLFFSNIFRHFHDTYKEKSQQLHRVATHVKIQIFC